MFLTRVPGFGNTTNLNRNRRRRPSTSPVVGRRRRPTLEALETRQLLSNLPIPVTTCSDSGPGSLRQAIQAADNLVVGGVMSPVDIVFNIPASTAPLLDVPVPGFDPGTQTWRIQLATPLPPITNTVSIDGYNEAPVGVPYRYPNAVSSAVQSLALTGSPTGGTFTLTTAAPLPVGKTGPIPYDATAATVQAALGAIVGINNIAVTGGPSPGSPFAITFQNAEGLQSIPNLGADGTGLTGGTTPGVLVQTTVAGGAAIGDLTYIVAVPNSTGATQGNDAEQRVIIDGSHIPAASAATGFVLDASDSLLRGLIITGFNVGVSVSALDTSKNPVVGDLIQGNSIGDYFLYPVDPETGAALPSPDNVGFTEGDGNAQQGVVLNSSNTTVGGNNPQEDNIICGNGAQGILVEPGASGNQILGNQIGMAGPSINGLYSQDGNRAEGVLIESLGNLTDPLSIVFSSSNIVGSASVGNLISANAGAGVRLVGVGAIRNLIQGNYIGVAPGGGYKFGTGDPGNRGDGVRIEDGSLNQIGGSSSALGNTIDSNHGAGIYLTGLATGNVAANNMIGVTAAGSQVLGNWQEGVALYSPNNTIGPGNVISQNLLGIGIYGPGASQILVDDNLIGTDVSGTEFGFGNATEGVLIDNSSNNTIQGNPSGSQVISGNDVGVEILGGLATGNLLLGNLIGSDKTGMVDLGNKNQGVLISNAPGNTVGGNTAASLNLISANHIAITIDGAGATGNLVQGNYIGTDITGLARLGNETVGIVISTMASKNTIGGMTADVGNKIAFHTLAGVEVDSGTGNSILSNSIWANGHLGIDLVAPGDPPSGVTPNPVPPNPPVRTGPNNLQAYPVLSYVTSNGTLTHIHGTLYSQTNTEFLIQFFTNPTADPSGYGQGQYRFGSATVMTDATGNVVFDATLTTPFTAGMWLSATATNLTTGDTSEFAKDISQSPAMEFSAATYTVNETDGSAVITVVRTTSQGTSTVNYATVSGGTAVPIIDYTPVSDTLTFNPGVTTQTFVVPINDSPQSVNITKTVNLALTTETGGYADFQTTAVLSIIDHAQGSSRVFWVTNTQDSGLGSLRQAILNANARPGPDDIAFAIPASLDPNLNVPVPGFDPATQTWTINLQSALPTITDQVIIDGYTQGEFPIPYRYPSAFTEIQILTVTGTPTGGSFTLSAQSPLPLLTTGDLPYNATASEVQLQLVQMLGMNNVTVSGGPANVAPLTITFAGDYQGQTVPALVPTSELTGGVDPTVVVTTSSQLGAVTQISSITNTIAATNGNNAHIPVIVDGSEIPGGAPGFVINTTDSILRGLIIDGFTIGVSVPRPVDMGNLIQGNCIGGYYLYPVDPTTGTPVPAPGNNVLAGLGNSQQGIYIDGENTTVGGTNPQENNVIVGSGLQGILIDVDAQGNVVEGNEIGIIGPSENGYYNQVGNQGVGVLVYGSSNAIGGPGGGSGNLISANQQGGVQIVGPAATRNIVAANYIGIGPGGGYLFGTGNPGNNGDGVQIENSTQNQVGGPDSTWANVISSNSGAGVEIDGITSTGNTVENNLIGLTADGKAVKGNYADGVVVFSPQNTIGPGNVISGNLRGVRISGPDATDVVVRDNLIGTDITGTLDLGNALEGIRIEDATDAQVLGDASGPQVISGNYQGVVITGSTATGNLVAGNLIGSDETGLHAIPNAYEGVAILGAPGNTIGGTTAGAQNLISANHWGVRLDGSGAVDNVVEGNLIGPDITGKEALGDEVNGVIVSSGASNNMIGGTSASAGNTIAFNVLTGVRVESGTGDSILSNSIYSNGQLGIDLVTPSVAPGPNNLQRYPVLEYATSNGSITHVHGTIQSASPTTFLIQFFSNVTPDPSGFGQGETGFGSLQVTTVGGNVDTPFDLQFASVLPPGVVISATATNLATGDTSEFAKNVAQTVALQFMTATYVVDQSSGTALITVSRTLTTGTSTVQFATADGTAHAGQDYSATSGSLSFNPGVATQTFPITVIDTHQAGGFKTVNLALSNPTGGVIDFQPTAVLRIFHNGSGTAGLLTVTNTLDSGPGSLRQAILYANSTPGPNDITFNIPAATDPLLDVPVSGFDPTTQDWTITLSTPLPALTDTVSIDGFTQGNVGVPFRYPSQVSSAQQQVAVLGNPTGGYFTLETQVPLPPGRTDPIVYNATPDQVQAALSAIPGMAGNIVVSGSPSAYTVSFRGAFAGEDLPDLIGDAAGLLGSNPTVQVQTVIVGGMPISDPLLIKSIPNTLQARDGNNARVRVIVDGSQTGGGTGFEIDTSDSVLRGLIIDGFDVGVSVPNPGNIGNSIQGDFIGQYDVYPVDAVSGSPLPSPNNVILAGQGNLLQGVYLNAQNTTVGGTNPQENNVISGNGLQGIFIDAAATGNVIEGNQIGMIGPSDNGLYFQVGNGTEGILVFGSSNAIGGSGAAAANVISGNGSDGIRVVGPVASRTIIGANLIGLAPGGGYLFGTGNPGNGGDGVLIENSASNVIGGPDSTWGNAISSNSGDGVLITGAASTGNAVLNNMIGLTADGKGVKGNLDDGVEVDSPQNTIGPGNVISGNLRGVNISGSLASEVVVQGNLIGTDSTGAIDLGNATEGILIQNATDALIEGDAVGSQVISGNLQGIVISGATSTRNLVEGNLIGTDKTGLYAIPNAQEGVAILGAAGNTIGGTTAAALNLISGNNWGVRLDGSSATANLVEGNYIGTDITGKAPLANEVNGVIVSNNASANTIGGTVSGAGNTIAFNVLTGVRVESGTGDSILSNSIYSNGQLGIILVTPSVPPGPNNLQAAPVLTTAIGGGPSSAIQGTLASIQGTLFLIQFFTSLIRDPSGFGQGQTPIGSTTVTTDGKGNAAISFTPSSSLPANIWVTATATNTATGDTSEFSNAVSAVPVTEQFLTASMSVDVSAGSAHVHVERTGNPNAVVAVSYATSNGTAVAGQDYSATSGTLTFQAGETDKTFSITILPNPSQAATSVTVNLALSQPTGGSTLGSPSTAVLTINNNLPPILQFSSSAYTTYTGSNSSIVTVTRGGGSRGTTVQVHYATAGGSAVAGVDYTPVSGTLTFLANQTMATFTVPILHGGVATVTKTVGLVLSGPAGGAKLGPINKATLTIMAGSSPYNPGGRTNTVPPQVTGEQLVLGPTGITAVLFSFSQPLNPSRVPDLGNYGYYVDVAGANGVFGTSANTFIPLSAAQYNPATSTVTVIPSTPLPLNRFERITINGLANPLLGRGLINTSGVLLSGLSNGVPGSPFIATFIARTPSVKPAAIARTPRVKPAAVKRRK
jgi:hypothetical protein